MHNITIKHWVDDCRNQTAIYTASYFLSAFLPSDQKKNARCAFRREENVTDKF